jgi:hypothetical protein
MYNIFSFFTCVPRAIPQERCGDPLQLQLETHDPGCSITGSEDTGTVHLMTLLQQNVICQASNFSQPRKKNCV